MEGGGGGVHNSTIDGNQFAKAQELQTPEQEIPFFMYHTLTRKFVGNSQRDLGLFLVMTVDSSPVGKRRRILVFSPMDSDSAMERLASAKKKYGREIRVFETSIASAAPASALDIEETDDFYEFTPEDYYRLLATKKEDKYLKTKKIRDAEEAARRSRMTKAVIRVRFPDNYTLEVSFHPSEIIQSLVDLLGKVVAHPEMPFYLYTTPPKKQIKDMSQNFYSAGFVPGAIVYFAYDVLKGEEGAAACGPFLQEEVMSLQGLESIPEQPEVTQPTLEPEPVITAGSSFVNEQKPSDKKKIKPKWLKM